MDGAASGGLPVGRSAKFECAVHVKAAEKRSLTIPALDPAPDGHGSWSDTVID